MTLQERFESKYEIVEPGGCWVWTAAVNSTGYGSIGVGSRTDGTRRIMPAHRISWELHHGPIPKGDGYHGTCVLHRCDNRACVNPAHLFLGTQADNVLDMAAKGRTLSGEDHPNAKLTNAQVVEIRALRGKLSQRKIAARFGVSQMQISNIQTGKWWAA